MNGRCSRRSVRACGSVALACLLLLTGGSAGAQSISSLTKQQKNAEQLRQDLQQKIAEVSKRINESESDRKDVTEALRQSETEISRLNARLDDLDRQRDETEKELDKLRSEQASQQGLMEQRREELALQLKSQYTNGVSPWAALLSGDDGQKIGRDLTYLSYVAKARTQAVQALNVEIARLDAVKKKVADRQKTLLALASEAEKNKGDLEQEKQKHSAVLARVEADLKARRSQAGNLARDDKRLNALIDDIQSSIVKQREAIRQAAIERAAREAARRKALQEARERAAQEAARQAALAAKRAEQTARQAQAAREAEQRAYMTAEEQTEALRRARENAPSTGVTIQPAPDLEAASRASAAAQQQLAQARMQRENLEIDREKARLARLRAEEEVRLAQKAREDERKAAAEASSGADGLQRGAPWPVRGSVSGRFGTPRPDTGDVWRGILIRAGSGTPVKAIGSGSVVYASWVQGFGNLIIVDHQNGYLSVYGYNQSLSKSVGDRVRIGQTIARVGATGGQVDPGLYFEIRKGSTPVDPMSWLAR
ncbi:peptidase [Advenella kashmirensis W13003]|uniref:Peptidase n=1 Tax=Advenella kashmirensis W13003 TaxID=1424334 RepID=V8QTP7_9BURK|nr:peptidoglycan DD-metalloendopeptidase family protein [Advenella kashmirensis]ETF03316.1 peptidase [Advenella kashmirensis W13003]